VFMLPRLPVLK